MRRVWFIKGIECRQYQKYIGDIHANAYIFLMLLVTYAAAVDNWMPEQSWRQRDLQRQVINNGGVISQNGRLVQRSGVEVSRGRSSKLNSRLIPPVHKQRSITIIQHVVMNYSSMRCSLSPLPSSPSTMSLTHFQQEEHQSAAAVCHHPTLEN